MAINSKVLTTHPDYLKVTKCAELVRAIIANDAKRFIPDVDPHDWARNQAYKDIAILTNYTKLTLDGFKGLVYRKPAKIELPVELEYLLADANGEGLGIEQLSMKMFDEVETTGNVFGLVDYPQVASDDISMIDYERGGYLARIKLYTLENVYNYKCRTVGSKHIPWLVVLREFVDDHEDNIFSWDLKEQFRVLMLDASGNYCQVIMDGDDKYLSDVHYPKDYNGNYLKEIPFKFIGAQTNDYKYDDSPLYPIATVNLGHYRNSADFEESVFINGQAMVCLSVGDVSVSEFNEVNPEIKFGSRKITVLGNGGNVSVAQVNPNILSDSAMKRKEEQIVSIGARIIAPAGAGRETAEGARIRYGSQNSSLYITTSNISLGLTDLIKWVAQFQGADIQTCYFELNKEFYDETADANLLTAQMLMLDRGVITKNDIRDYGRKAGFIDDMRTNEEIEAEAELVDPLEGLSGNSGRPTQASNLRTEIGEE